MAPSDSPGWYDTVYPSALREAEARLVVKRRAALTDAPVEAEVLGHPAMPDDTVGVALSGGGIRSATFCLGVFRALARAQRIRRIDFLSTVSGGGYFGSFLGAMFVRQPVEPTTTIGPEQVEAQLLDLHSKPVGWLRENGRYMSPNGSGDTLLAGAVLLRNWIAVLVVLSAAAVTAFAAIGVLLDWTPNALLRVSSQAGVLRQALNGAGVSPSPLLELPLLLVLLAIVPLGWSYWFTQRAWPFGRQRFLPPLLGALVVVPVLVLTVWPTFLPAAWGWLAILEGVLATGWWVVAWALSRRDGRKSKDKGAPAPDRLERNRLSRWLSVSLWTAVSLAVFATIDSAGRTLAVGLQTGRIIAVLAPTLTVALGAFGIVQKLRPMLESVGGSKRLSFPPQLILGALAFVVCSVVLVGLATLTHRLGQDGLWLPLVFGAVLTVAFAWTLPFLNLSSQNTLYAARLTRAYLGASNPRRHEGQVRISETIPGDGIAFGDYRPFDRGGPLHLVNVTLNETASGRSQLEQRDRKGLPMALGPSGMSVGSRHHATWAVNAEGRDLEPVPVRGDFQVFPAPGPAIKVEELGLGEWISISGAAFSTGLGSRTNLALSVLLGLSNVRLGYWWNSGIDPGRRAVRGKPLGRTPGLRFAEVMPFYSYFFDELLARFHGPARPLWYLSDGGHFENTGAYELLRRRVPFILVCDDGCDPKYAFEDLAGLVRKARLDFSAEIAFYPKDVLVDLLPAELVGYFGEPSDFRASGETAGGSSQPQRTVGPHALLAAVFYEDPERRKKAPDSVLVILKPSVSGDEPLDVVEYQRAHPQFPQESTMDQFFGEAQWESYRRLGEHIASRIFGEYPGGKWRPLDLNRPPETQWQGTSRGSPAP